MLQVEQTLISAIFLLTSCWFSSPIYGQMGNWFWAKSFVGPDWHKEELKFENVELKTRSYK